MPKAQKSPQLPNEKEGAIAEALFWRKSHPGDGWREIAKRFGVNKDTLCRRSKGGKSRVASGGHNTKLIKEEEKGLLETID
jgi:hypothetical protein